MSAIIHITHMSIDIMNRLYFLDIPEHEDVDKKTPGNGGTARRRDMARWLYPRRA